MTEVPEHLLARSRARREAAGLATPSESSAAPATTTGSEVEAAPAAAATPAPAAAPAPPPPPKPDPPYVQAYKNRRRIPVWAMPALAVLPLWAFVYANTLEKPPAATAGPLVAGKKIFESAGCASCHGATGGGGSGPAFVGGVLSKDWPKFQDQIRWVSLGSNGWPGSTYGANNKPKQGGMPSWAGTLTPLQIAEVVRYEREVLSGVAPEPDLVAITEGTKPPLDKDGNPVASG